VIDGPLRHVRRELAFGATISVSSRGTYCSPCYNTWLAAESGVRFDNAELEPVTLRDARGVPHTFRIHSRLAPGAGHVMEAFEEETEGFGYQFKVMGPEESDAMALFRELYARMRRGLDRRYLKEGEFGLQLVEGDALMGRIEMDVNTHEPVLVVDGRPRSWEDIGRLLLSYEGWHVDVQITDAIEEAPDVPEPGEPSDERH
jgi:hypothetical protein